MPRLFRATIGGMGLTGLILSASIRLMRVPSLDIVEKATPFRDLGELFRRLPKRPTRPTNMPSPGSTNLPAVAAAGRGVLLTGNHARAWLPARASRAGGRLSVPFQPPLNVLNRPFLTAFNAAYRWKKGGDPGPRQVGYQGFFFPLDGLGDWNRLYGPKGLFQHQSVVPEDAAREAMPALLECGADGPVRGRSSPC